MTPKRLRQIGQQLYRRERGWVALLAADLGVSQQAVKSWLTDRAWHRDMHPAVARVLERAARRADALQLWDRPAEAVAGLIFQRLDALLPSSVNAEQKE